MQKAIYSLYYFKFANASIDSIYSRIIIRIANIVCPLYFGAMRIFFKKKYSLNKRDSKCNNIIVSLTSFPKRINFVWLTIESILCQNEKPDRVILWLFEGEFDGIESLPYKLLQLRDRGLEIRFCYENLKPHKKYYYTMYENPDSIVITVDDDTIYPPDFVEKLALAHKKNPESIICTIACKIVLNEGKVVPYMDWEDVQKNTEPSTHLMPVGAGGVLYPPGSLHMELMNIEALKETALLADDLWLMVMGKMNKTKVACVTGDFPRYAIPIYIKLKDNIRLADINIGEGNNDKVLALLEERYAFSGYLK